MRNISKSSEPRSLTGHRCQANSDYNNYSEKDDLRKSLVSEQRGLCCYCTQRIRPATDKMKIEHWRCQSRFPEKQLDYSNLLGACLGCQGQALARQHCDTRKGDRDLIYNPADPNHDVESKLTFPGDGTIQAKTDEMFDHEINKILNLNARTLMEARKSALKGIQTGFKTKNLSKADIQKELRKWNGERDSDNLEPFYQIVVYYLRKKLSRM